MPIDTAELTLSHTRLSNRNSVTQTLLLLLQKLYPVTGEILAQDGTAMLMASYKIINREFFNFFTINLEERYRSICFPV